MIMLAVTLWLYVPGAQAPRVILVADEGQCARLISSAQHRHRRAFGICHVERRPTGRIA